MLWCFCLASHITLTPESSWLLHSEKPSLRNQGLELSIQHNVPAPHTLFPPAPMVSPHPCDHTLTSNPHHVRNLQPMSATHMLQLTCTLTSNTIRKGTLNPSIRAGQFKLGYIPTLKSPIPGLGLTHDTATPGVFSRPHVYF